MNDIEAPPAALAAKRPRTPKRSTRPRCSPLTRLAAIVAGTVGIAGAGVAGGCRSYERRPLDLSASKASWLERTADHESVRQFAERLAKAEGTNPETPFDPTDGLTLREAEAVALVFNRDLRIARQEADITRAAADYAGGWDDPALGIDLERIISGVPDPWVISGSVSLTIPISGRLAAEKARAGAEHTAQLERLAAQEWATRTSLRELWIEWSLQSLRARLNSESIDRLRSLTELAAHQEQAGVLSGIDLRLLRVELASSRAEHIGTAARATELELQIRDTLGLSPQAPLQLVEAIALAPRYTDPTALQSAMEAGNAELAIARTEYELAEQSLHLEIRKQFPHLTIGPGYGTEDGEERVLLGLSLPLPIWNRNRQGVAQADAAREAARTRFDGLVEHLGSRVAISLARYDTSLQTAAAIQTLVLPLAEQLDADVRRTAELGRVDPVLLLRAVESARDAKLKLVEARASTSIAAVMLDSLAGPPIPARDADSPTHDPALNSTTPTNTGGQP